MRKKLLVSLCLTLMCSTPAMAQRDWLAKQMYTVAPYVQLYGPVQGTMLTNDFKTKVFRIIVEEGHEKARDFLQTNDHDAYWAFMVAALTVPLHEGSNLHFRKKENDGSNCQQRSNSGSILSASSRYSGTFNRIFKIAPSPILPDCEEFSDDPLVHQLLHGHDGSDLGIMQVNLYWHERNYLATGDWTSVRKSVRYGLALLKQGFEGVYRNSNRYSCVQSNGAVNFYNLIRASWAGMYNSGNLGASCRFTNSASDWARNDINFKKSLDTILSLDDADARNRNYKLLEREDAILSGIIEHYKNKTASAALMTNYLVTTQVEGTDKVQPILDDSGRVVDAPTPARPVEPAPVVVIPSVRREFDPIRLYAVKATVLNFRDGPGTQFTDCGDLPKNAEVIVKAQQGDWMVLVNDEMLASYQSENHTCQNGERFAHKDFLIDKGPLYDDPPVEEPAPVVVVVPTPTPTPAVVVVEPAPVVEQRNTGRVKDWVNVREDRPRGYTVAAPTGDVVGPAGAEIVIAETIWNSSNSKYPWYRITSPVHGWIYGQFVEVDNQE